MQLQWMVKAPDQSDDWTEEVAAQLAEVDGYEMTEEIMEYIARPARCTATTAWCRRSAVREEGRRGLQAPLRRLQEGSDEDDLQVGALPKPTGLRLSPLPRSGRVRKIVQRIADFSDRQPHGRRGILTTPLQEGQGRRTGARSGAGTTDRAAGSLARPRLSFFARPIAGSAAGQAHEADDLRTDASRDSSKSWPLGFRAIAERMAARTAAFPSRCAAGRAGRPHPPGPGTGTACLCR